MGYIYGKRNNKIVILKQLSTISSEKLKNNKFGITEGGVFAVGR